MHRMTASLMLLGLGLGLAGCATPIAEPGEADRIPPPINPRVEPSVTLELGRTTAEARPFIEEIAARCWLDGVVQADAMLVDRATGKIVMTGENDDLLTIVFLPVPTEEGFAQMRLTGPVLANESQTERLIGHLERAQTGGEIACPPIASPGKETPVITAS